MFVYIFMGARIAPLTLLKIGTDLYWPIMIMITSVVRAALIGREGIWEQSLSQ